MYDEKTAIAQPSLELRLDELYKELGKAYYEGALKIHYHNYYLFLMK